MPLLHCVSALAGRISPARVSASSSVVSIDEEVVQRLEREPDRGRGSSSMHSRYSAEWRPRSSSSRSAGASSRSRTRTRSTFRRAARRSSTSCSTSSRRRRHRPRALRAALPAEAAAGGRRRRGDLAEARARAAAGLDRDGARHVPVGTARRRALRDRARARRLGGEPRDARVRRVAVAAARSGEARTSCASTSTRSRAPGFAEAKQVAAVVHEVLDEIGYVGWPKTSGNRGVHVYCRIEPNWEFRVVRRCALAFAREIERRAPELVTTAWWKEERGERVFVDYNQNARDRTILSAYSVRGRPDATVSAPVRVGRAARRRDGGLHDRDDAAALRGARRPARRDRRGGVRPARAARVGRARGGGGRRRGAVPAELPEDAGRAEARAAVAGEEEDAS